MPITFEPLTTTDISGKGGLFLALRASGIGFELAADAGYGALELGLTQSGVGDAADVLIEPPIPANGLLNLFLGPSGEGAETVQIDGTGESSLVLSATGFSFTNIAAGDTPSAGFSELVIDAGGAEDIFSGNYAILAAMPPIVSGYAGLVFEEYTSSVVLASDTEDQLILLIESLVRLSSSVSWSASLEMSLTSSLTARAVFTVLLETQFTETLLLSDDVDPILRMIIGLADSLVLTGEVETVADALIVISAGLALSDATVFGTDVSLEDTMALVSEHDDLVRAIIEAADTLALTDELTPTASFTTLFSDTLATTAEPAYSLAAMLELLDTANFGVRLNLPGNDGGLYVGYAMNIRNAGMTKYENYPFTGFAVVGGLPLAVGEEGLYSIGGDTDAGEPIHAKIRTGLTDFGTAMLKHNPNAWLGYTSNGALVLKVITADKGRKKENWYRLRARENVAPVEDRWNIAKGLTGLYWGYEIVNVDGADFELDMVKTWPFAIQRRKSGR